MKPLIARYPDFLAGSAEFVEMQDVLEPELLALWEARDGLLEQLQLQTATWGLQAWERTLGIAVEEEKDPAFRRSRIRSKLRGVGVTTVAMVRSLAESFTNGEVAVLEHPQRFELELKFVGSIGIPPNLDDLTAALQESLPAHLRWEYVLVYNTWGVTKLHTWGELRKRTWAEAKGEKWT